MHVCNMVNNVTMQSENLSRAIIHSQMGQSVIQAAGSLPIQKYGTAI